MRRVLVLALLVAAACGGHGDDGWPDRERFGGPLSAQGGAAVTSFAGVIDPTNTSFAGGMVASTLTTPSALLTEQNRAAFKAAIDYAAAHQVTLYVPPGRYPMTLASGQSYAVDFGGDSNVMIDARGATFALVGNLASSPATLFWLRNTAHVRITGAVFSQRDVTNPTVDTLMIKVGDGGATSTDDVQLVDDVFQESATGDCIRLDGGGSAETVTRTLITRSRFETCARDAVQILPGARKTVISWSWFWNSSARDVDVAAGPDNVNGQIEITGNTMQRASGSTAASITLAGNAGAHAQEQSLVRWNRLAGGILEGANLGRTLITQNAIEYNRAAGASGNVDLTGRVFDVWIVDNYLRRGASATSGPVVHVAAVSGNAPKDVTVRGNRVYQYSGIAPGIDLTGTQRATVTNNSITYHAATADSGATGFVGIYCAGATGVCAGTVERNSIRRDDQDIKASATLASFSSHVDTVVEAELAGRNGNNLFVHYVGDSATKAGSRTETSTTTTLHFKPGSSTVADMEALYPNSQLTEVRTPGTQSNVLQATVDEFTAPLSGGLQAGRMLAGVEYVVGGGTTINRLVLRDNHVDGAQVGAWIDADGAAAWPEGYPIISGNFFLNVGTPIGGGITTYRTESSPGSETKASGALSVVLPLSVVTTANTAAYTLGDAVTDGFVHCVKVASVSGSPAGTLTPTHFADGTTHTLTWSAAGGYACLTWDATASTYRLLGSSGVTVN